MEKLLEPCLVLRFIEWAMTQSDKVILFPLVIQSF